MFLLEMTIRTLTSQPNQDWHQSNVQAMDQSTHLELVVLSMHQSKDKQVNNNPWQRDY